MTCARQRLPCSIGGMMISAGIDIGSRTVKLALASEGEVILSRKVMNTHNPLETCIQLLDGVEYDSLTATGYGRHLISNYLPCSVVSEIKAFAAGARYFNPDCKAILDIGGQDTKAITLDDSGNVKKFEMNDKCSAGTGRFLEIMATALGFKLEEFAAAAISAERYEEVNSTCTVFAESEVISLVTRGVPRNEIALGIHRSIASRSISLLKRVQVQGNIFFAGGVAFNRCMRMLVEEGMCCGVFIPDDPQITGAAGCALINSR